MSFDAFPDPANTNPISKDYYVEVREGNISGRRIIEVNGVSLVAGITVSNVWAVGGLLVYPTTGEQWELVFADANDTAAGSGAQEVTIRYLDDTYTEQSEAVASNGGTAVMTATDSFRFIEAKTTAIGSGGKNAGTVTVQVSGGGAARALMIAGSNVTLSGFYTVPLGKTASIIYAYTGVQKNKDSQMAIFVTDGDDGIFVETLPLIVYQNTFVLSPPAPALPMIAKTDLQVQVISENNSTKVALFSQILEVDDA